MQKKLAALPEGALMNLKTHVDAELLRRKRNTLASGKIATFYNREGALTRLFITRSGPVIVIGHEVGVDGVENKMARWKLNRALLTPAAETLVSVAPMVDTAA